jgi:YhcH/YjgK/YiaL family protein
MIYGTLSDRETYWLADRHPVLGRAFAWLRALPEDQAPGIYELQGRQIYVNVHGYDTLARDECVFESHRVYADLQYCIAGGELIDYAWRPEVGVDRVSYDAEKDFLFSNPPSHFSTLRMAPGKFGFFMPTDAHRPKVNDGVHPSVRKLVIKIDVSLLN